MHINLCLHKIFRYGGHLQNFRRLRWCTCYEGTTRNSFKNQDTRRAQRNYNIRSFKLVGPFISASFAGLILPVIIILFFFYSRLEHNFNKFEYYTLRLLKMKKIRYSRVLHRASKRLFFSALKLVLSGNLRVGTLPLYNKKRRFGSFNTGPFVRLIRQGFVQVYNSGVRPLLWWSFTILRGGWGKLIFVMPWSTIFGVRESWCAEKLFCESWLKCTPWNLNCQNPRLFTRTLTINWKK